MVLWTNLPNMPGSCIVVKIRTRNELRQALAIIRERMLQAATPFGDAPQARAKRIARSRKDKRYFFKTYLPHYFNLSGCQMHKDIVKALDGMKPTVIAAPRGHAKSTIASLAYPLHQIVFGLRHFIVLASSTEERAVDLTSFVKLELEDNPRIRQDFGDLVGPNWAEGDFTTTNNVRVLSRGRGQSIRGIRHRQYRPDLMVIDDMETDSLVRNPRRVQQALRWVTEAVFPSLEPGGSLLIVGTLLARKSVLGLLLTDDAYKGSFERLRYSAIKGNGKPLWSAKFSLSTLNEIKSVIGTLSFAKEYMNDPRDDEGMFRPEWIRYYAELPATSLRKVAFLDPALGRRGGDYSAYLTLGQAQNGDIYVIAPTVARLSPQETTNLVQQEYVRHNPMVIGVEANGFQSLMLDKIEEGMALPLKEVKHSEPKEVRIGRLSPLMERGRILFPAALTDGTKELIEQLLYYPSPTVHDDGPDCLAAAVQMLSYTRQFIGVLV